MINFKCTSCGKELSAKKEYAGMNIACPECGIEMKVPPQMTSMKPHHHASRDITGIPGGGEKTDLHTSFQHDYYLFRRKVFKIFGGAFHVYDREKKLLFYSKQKAFKLKEDLRVYADESQALELLNIKTPRVLDLGATYNVVDSTTGEAVGALRRKFLKSFLKDEWVFLSRENQEIGKLTEKSILGALLSRFINLIPQSYVILGPDGEKVAEIKQHFNPFVLRYEMTILEAMAHIDRRLLVSAGILLAAIERRQRS